MAQIYLLNKPFQVLSQFTDKENRRTLSDFLNTPGIYPAGRLDYDSEGLLLLTSDGVLQARIAEPKFKLDKHYWVQVEGQITNEALQKLQTGVTLKDGPTKPAKARIIEQPNIWERTPPIRFRANQNTSWLELVIREGRNRQVRRMTAEVGFPTLRLIRHQIGPWSIDGIAPGEFRTEIVHLPKSSKPMRKNRDKSNRKI